MIRRNFYSVVSYALFVCLLLQSATYVAVAQTAAPTAAPKPTAKAAPAKVTSRVDSVIQLFRSGMSESIIVKTLQQQNKPIVLTTDDLVKLQNAKVPESIINAMMDPKAAAAPVPAPAAVAPPPPPPPAPPAAPVAPTPLTAAVAQAMKKRVIVDDFDYSTVMTSVQAVFGTQQNIGKGIRAMLTNKMAQQARVVVVERAKMDTLLKEQDNSAGGRFKQGTGARIGRISGADALMTGDITTFGRDDKKKGGGLGGLGGGWIGGAAAAMSASKTEDKAVVVITYRMVDAETSEIIATGQARGESVRKSKALAAFAAGWNRGTVGAGGGSFDMTSSNFSETIIGEATQDCVNKLADILNTQAEAMKKAARAVEASVADVAGNVLTITAGGNDGVNQGDVFEILKVVREVRDPATKEVLDRITEKVGEMTVTSVRDKIATGNYLGSPAQVMFVARKKL